MDEDGRAAGWTIFGVLCAFKLTTAVAIFFMLPSRYAATMLLIFHWYWLLPLVILSGLALVTWLRLVRVRAKRERLRRAEFSLD